MRCLILGIAWLVITGAVCAAEPKTAPATGTEAVLKALESFAGTWELVTVRPEGAAKNARRLVFNQDGSYAAHDADGKELWAGTYEIDPTVTPKRWDHRSHDAKREGRDVLGVYELDGDTLRVACVAGRWNGKEWVGKSRLNAVASPEADVVIDLKRVKPNKVKSSLPNQETKGTTMIDQIPGPAASYVRTINAKDQAAFIALFADDAVVDDAGRTIQGREAIKAWAADDIFAADVTLSVLSSRGNEHSASVTGKVDGTFDRTGLPNPLVMTFDVATRAEKITKLTCRLAEK
jgi:uncharacterized protein (TIGR03067 family)